MSERSAKINIAGKDYELVLSTGAVKEIGKKYGGIAKIGELMATSDDIDKSFETVEWLICLLANQGVAMHNFMHPEQKKEKLTEEIFELFTTPADLSGFQSAIIEALNKGLKRNILSEENEEKNATNG